MTIGDKVIMSPGTQGDHATYAPDGPLFGVIVVENGGSPDLASVLWEDGTLTLLVDRDAVLKKIEFGEGEDADVPLTSNLGKFVQMSGFPEVGTAGSRPKSPAAAGVVHRAFVVFPDFSDPDPDLAFVVMSWYDGRIRACVPAPSALLDPAVSALREILTAQPGRRDVGKG